MPKEEPPNITQTRNPKILYAKVLHLIIRVTGCIYIYIYIYLYNEIWQPIQHATVLGALANHRSHAFFHTGRHPDGHIQCNCSCFTLASTQTYPCNMHVSIQIYWRSIFIHVFTHFPNFVIRALGGSSIAHSTSQRLSLPI